MPMEMTRRGFLQATAATAATALMTQPTIAQQAESDHRPVVIASANGLSATEKAAGMIRSGADTLDAVVAGVNIVEADPKDHSVGFGGLPNEDGVVELDAAVMHGPTHRAGAVAALRNIVHPSSVAQVIMARTDHIMLVGEGALRFARAHGFKEQDLLTDEARQMWLHWKENLSAEDDWVPAEGEAAQDVPSHGTIHCAAVNTAGEVSAVTTTSGLAYKIPGRVGDSPIIGAGLYVDNEVGAAGATGRGEAVILNSGSFAIVEQMRNGRSPEDACLVVLTRIVDHTKNPRLLRDDGRPNFQVIVYAVAKDGRVGSAAIWASDRRRARFAVYSNGRNRIEDCAYLFESGPRS